MKKRKNYSLILLFGLLLLGVSCSTTKNIALAKQELTLVNRTLKSSDNEDVIHLNAKRGSGFAMIEDVAFTTGTIEVDLLGEDVKGKSFVGIAFNIENDSTYEAVYFRPFNFLSEEKIRREHSIQYIYHPTYTWKKLRTEYNGVYEAEFVNPPSPNDWFTVRINITNEEVTVIDPKTNERLLNIKRLTESKSAKIGFWTGHNSKGGFRNLRIKE